MLSEHVTENYPKPNQQYEQKYDWECEKKCEMCSGAGVHMFSYDFHIFPEFYQILC